MLRYLFLFYMILLSFNDLFSKIQFIGPSSYYQGCGNEAIMIKWNCVQPVVLMARIEKETNFEMITNDSILGGQFLWNILDSKYYNVPIDIKVMSISDTNDTDELFDIFLYQPTEIIDQTQSEIACKGENLDLFVDANGYNLKYQWMKDNRIIENENRKFLTLKNIDYEQSGTYECLVIGELECNTTKSKPIVVYVASPTAIFGGPNHQGWRLGGKAKFSVDVHINGEYGKDIKFQWYKGKERIYNGDGNYSFLKNKNRISGATSHELVFDYLLPKDSSDSIYCVVTGKCGTVKSKFAKLQEDVFFSYNIPKQEIFACVGYPVNFIIYIIQNEPGTLTYQWFRSGNKILADDDRISGTTSNILTNNSCKMSDLGNYYLRITHEESGFFINTTMVSLYAESDPNLITEIKDYTIFSRENGTKYYGKIHLMIGSLLMIDKYYFEWYKNDSFFLNGNGLKGAEIMINNPSFADEGKYYCIIYGSCGITYSDTFNIFMGYKDIMSCAGSDTVLSARKHKLDTGQMKYYWQFRNNKLKDQGRYEGTSTLDLKVKSITSTQEGTYNLFALDTILNKTYSNGFIYLDVAEKPKILREYFSSKIQIKAGKTIKLLTVISKNSMKIELFNGDKLTSSKWFAPQNWIDVEFNIYLGCKGPNCIAQKLDPGIYKFKLSNDCGEIWSSEFTVLESDTVKGIVLNSYSDSNTQNYYSNEEQNDFVEESSNDAINDNNQNEMNISDNKDFIVYPNPANEYITIHISNKGLKHFATNGSSVEIYDVMGILIQTTPSASHPPLHEGNLRIDVSNLTPGVYFVKIGGSNGPSSIVEKFVKM